VLEPAHGTANSRFYFCRKFSLFNWLRRERGSPSVEAVIVKTRFELRVAVSAIWAALAVVGTTFCSSIPAPQNEAKAGESAAAKRTRTDLLKTKVSGDFQDVRLGDILKEFAAQVDMKAGEPVLWSYGPGFPFAKKTTFTAKDEPLEVALDRLFTKIGGGLGYVVVSKDGDKYDGWVRLTTNGERGMEPKPPTPEEEAAALERLVLAKKLIDAGKPASARPLLEILVKKYPGTKAGMEAKPLLEKLDK
jgi:hypothetical protein